MTREPAADARGAARRLVVTPFRAVRFTVADLAAVTSPPYDVVESDTVAVLETADAHNVVRLILPRDDTGRADDPDHPDGGDRYRHAAVTLEGWRRDGSLAADATPAVYVHDQQGPAGTLRGVVGAVRLPDGDEGPVLPHEDVMTGPVRDRLALMRATQANLEPILLLLSGEGDAGAVADDAVGGHHGSPVIDVETPDGTRHRVWRVDEPGTLRRLATDLRRRRALIADGHHRYAAYRQLRQEAHRAGRGPGPWDFGLALLVDGGAHPLTLGAIHRVVTGLDLDAATSAAAGHGWSVTPTEAAAPSRPGEYVLADGAGRAMRLTAGPAAAATPGRSALWRSLDTAVLHEVLLPTVWRSDEGAVTYHHTADGALRAALRGAGLAVLLAPVPVATVMELAAQGERMPRKSTSFGPKPRTGLLLRTFSDG